MIVTGHRGQRLGVKSEYEAKVAAYRGAGIHDKSRAEQAEGEVCGKGHHQCPLIAIHVLIKS